MSAIQIWDFIYEHLQRGEAVFLLWVLQSEGSSPGRQGFKMAVSSRQLQGTIGGGIMEYKLAEKARALLQTPDKHPTQPFLMQQFHDKAQPKNQSGMICSGSQTLAFVPLTASHLPLVVQLIRPHLQHPPHTALQLSPQGISWSDATTPEFVYHSDSDWHYCEPQTAPVAVHIIGAGHVGLALSQVLHFLGFYVKIYDDRPQLNTLEQNTFAHEKHHVSDYRHIKTYLKHVAPTDFVVVMTLGYRSDKVVLQQLLPHAYRYLGVLGSEKKIAVLLQELSEEGYDAEQLATLHAPIGLPIYSRSAEEIAVSIAAQIIQINNRHLPTGRSHSLH